MADIKKVLADNEELKRQVQKLTDQLSKNPDELLNENIKLIDENKELTTKNIDLASQAVELQKTINLLQQGASIPANIKGFLLEVGDPFALCVIPAYRKAGGKSSQPDRLPFVLPEKDDASKAALAEYIIRAESADDKIRVAAARKFLPFVPKIKK